MIKVQINNICAKLIECEPLTAGMIGKTLDVEMSAEWQNYTKTAVFSNGDTTIDVLESQWDGNTITIPAEVLSIAGRTVIFGMYGFAVENGTTVALPTIYAKIGIPMVGADPESDPTTNPALPVYAQLQWQIDHFEISDEQIAEQIQEYLEEHPIEIQPATASVLGGIKVGDGLSVTADGTLSADAPDLSEYAKTEDVDELANIVDGKQDAITDLATIRSGAALGATALQSVPNTYRTASAQDVIDSTKLSDAPSDGKQYARENGAWAEVQSGGGDNTLVVTVWLSDFGTPGVIIGTPGTTHAEIIDAIENGKDITLVAQLDDSADRYNFDIANSSGSYWPVVFGGLIPPNDDYWGEHTAVYISVSPANVWSISYADYALKSELNDYRTAAAQDAIDSGFVKLVGMAGQTIQTNVAVPLNVKNNIALQHRAFIGFQTHDDNAIGFIGVDSGKPTFLAADGVTAKALQGEAITDSAGYFTTDTVEGALAEIGGTLDGLEDAINTIRGVS